MPVYKFPQVLMPPVTAPYQMLPIRTFDRDEYAAQRFYQRHYDTGTLVEIANIRYRPHTGSYLATVAGSLTTLMFRPEALIHASHDDLADKRILRGKLIQSPGR